LGGFLLFGLSDSVGAFNWRDLAGRGDSLARQANRLHTFSAQRVVALLRWRAMPIMLIALLPEPYRPSTYRQQAG